MRSEPSRAYSGASGVEILPTSTFAIRERFARLESERLAAAGVLDKLRHSGHHRGHRAAVFGTDEPRCGVCTEVR